MLYAFKKKQFILLLYFCGYILASTLTESQWTDFSSFTFLKTAHDVQVTVLAVGAFWVLWMLKWSWNVNGIWNVQHQNSTKAPSFLSLSIQVPKLEQMRLMHTDHPQLRAILLKIFRFLQVNWRATIGLEFEIIIAQIHSRQPWIVFLSSSNYNWMWQA